MVQNLLKLFSFFFFQDKKLKVIDPRANCVVEEGNAHGNHKDSRIVCLGDSHKLATTGFSNVSSTLPF